MSPSDHIRVSEFDAAVQSYLGYSKVLAPLVTGPPVVGEENYGSGRGQQVKTLCGRTNHTLDYIGLLSTATLCLKMEDVSDITPKAAWIRSAFQ